MKHETRQALVGWMRQFGITMAIYIAAVVTATWALNSQTAPVLRTVRWVARLGDLGLPGVLSSSCGDGECCASFRADLTARIRPNIGVIAVHSRSDGIVDWRACLDEHAERVHVNSSHCGMSVHREVFRLLEHTLERSKEAAWSG